MPANIAAVAPGRLRLEEYFLGRTSALGLFEGRFGAPRREFTIDLDGARGPRLGLAVAIAAVLPQILTGTNPAAPLGPDRVAAARVRVSRIAPHHGKLYRRRPIRRTGDHGADHCDTRDGGTGPRASAALARRARRRLRRYRHLAALHRASNASTSWAGSRPMAVYGVLSLITWALTIVVTLKYITVIMRADNRGEGGILALTALALRAADDQGRLRWWILAAGLLGASLFYGDGVITPAISVLSAVEGLKVATPLFDPYVIPITLALLLVLFVMQRRGTALRRRLFRPGDGAVVLHHRPARLDRDRAPARDPVGAQSLLRHRAADRATRPRASRLLGAVVLAVTGAEALYADMGHFGRRPIRLAWVELRLPGAAAQLLRPGRAAARSAERARESVLPARPRTGRFIRWWCWRRWRPSSPRRR